MGMPFADVLAKSGAELRVFIEACLDPRDPLNRPSHVTATQGSRSRLQAPAMLRSFAAGPAGERFSAAAVLPGYSVKFVAVVREAHFYHGKEAREGSEG